MENKDVEMKEDKQPPSSEDEDEDEDKDEDIEIEMTGIDHRKMIDARKVARKGWVKKFINPPIICLDDHMAPFRQVLWEMKDETEKEKKDRMTTILKGQARKVLMTVTGKSNKMQTKYANKK